MGDDEKLINDIVLAAEDLKPKFIAVAGTPIPTMTGFDFEAVAALIEEHTGIPAFGFPTTGMNTYVHGANMALEAIARRFTDKQVKRTPYPSVNILGLTPLDFTVNGTDNAIARFLEDAGYQVLSRWAMGSNLEELAQAGSAHVNLVVSGSGLGAAKALKELFGTPYVTGIPVGSAYAERIRNALEKAVATGENQFPASNLTGSEILIIGEGISSLSLASALELSTGNGTAVLCPTECDPDLLREKDLMMQTEDQIQQAMSQAKVVIADPLYRPICPPDVRFLKLATEAFSGRLFREQIPNLVTHFESYFCEVL